MDTVRDDFLSFEKWDVDVWIRRWSEWALNCSSVGADGT